MRSRVVPPSEARAFAEVLADFVTSAQAGAVFVAVGEDAPIQLAELAAIARTAPVPIAGALFPRVIWGAESDARSIVLLAWRGRSDVAVLRDLGGPPEQLVDKVAAATRDWPVATGGPESVLVIVDALAPNIDDVLFELYATFGRRFTWFGGGAGRLDPRPCPVIACRDGISRESALLLRVEEVPGVGVAHGWKRTAGPFVATSAGGRTIRALNWEPAFQQYQQILASLGQEVTESRFYEVARDYPLGIERPSGHMIVRDPIGVDAEGGLLCVGSVPENAVLYLLHGEITALCEGARSATRDALARDPGGGSIWVADCISRALFLEDQLSTELHAIRSLAGEDAVLAGAMTVGEIASPAGTFLEFCNKTTVVAAFPRVEEW